MAKRKTPKVKKPSKISNEDLNRLQNTINTLNRTQMQIGVFHTNIHQLLRNVDGMNNQLTLMQSEFEKEYGTKDINISDGTINYEQTN
jgi:hypothetical protein